MAIFTCTSHGDLVNDCPLLAETAWEASQGEAVVHGGVDVGLCA
jgi:hypothetical protein